MKRYAKYRPSGVEWIGEMPVQWEVKRLKFNTYIKARVGWHGLRADEFSLTEGVYCVTGTDLLNGGVSWENCYRVSEERYEEDPFIQLRENDLLITKDGTIGKVAIVRNLNERATLNSGVFVVRPERKEYVTPFMYWALQSPVFSEYVNYTSKGSTINHLYQETFFNLPFILPEIDEQPAIAHYLDERTAQIDTLIANKQKLIELLKEERTAIINQAVTKGINPKGKLKPSGIEWLGDIPEHWEVKKLKYVLDCFDSKRVPLNAAERGEVKNIYDYYGASGVIDKVGDYLFDGDFILIGEDGANLLTRSTALAFKATGKFWVNNHAHILKPKDGNIDYFTYLLESIDYAIWVSGSAQPKLTADNLMNITICEPPLLEQHTIAHHIGTHISRIDATISKIEKEIELLQEYRTALISEVVTGKVKVV
ncbi:MAG: restriction endonuclease subunit S [Nitrospirae bacterium]|nr:restriction endonuclease subunit S [Nitrospirota bacterium]